jgi:hypothetical protein
LWFAEPKLDDCLLARFAVSRSTHRPFLDQENQLAAPLQRAVLISVRGDGI